MGSNPVDHTINAGHQGWYSCVMHMMVLVVQQPDGLREETIAKTGGVWFDALIAFLDVKSKNRKWAGFP